VVLSHPCELCSHLTGVYNPKTFILHAASLHQGCPHCERFSTAATRRCLDRVSVPVWLVVLSDQLPVVALVSHYLTNKLIGRGPILKRLAALITKKCLPVITSGINLPFGRLSQTSGQVAHVLRTRSPLNLYCYKPRSTCMSYPRRQRSF
jgi:hypothetical protein